MENVNANTETTEQVNTSNTETTGTNTDAIIETAVEKGKEQKENAILKSYFKQQGMEEAEIQEAIKNWKDAKAKQRQQEEDARKEAEAKKDEAIKAAEAKAEAAIKMLKNEKINTEVDKVAISLGVDPTRLSLVSRLIDKNSISIDDEYKIDSETVKKAIEDVLELVPELKKQVVNEQVGGFRFGASKDTTNAEPKTAKNLSLRESLALKYN